MTVTGTDLTFCLFGSIIISVSICAFLFEGKHNPEQPATDKQAIIESQKHTKAWAQGWKDCMDAYNLRTNGFNPQ